jgi:hypothetical protein
MQSPKKCALCKEVKPLCDSYYLPAALYRLARTNGSRNPHPVLISRSQYRQIALQVRDRLLCADCESRFDHEGESWMLRHCCRGRGIFRLRSLLEQRPALKTDGDSLTYSADEATARQLTYFSASVFWRGAVHKWSIGQDSSQLIQLGPFEEPLRLYLLGRCPFPSRVAIIAYLSSSSSPPLTSAYPKTFTNQLGLRLHRFYIPGVLFTLCLGHSADKIDFQSITTAPDHPVLVGPVRDELFMQDIVRFIRTNNPPRR